MHKSFNLMHYNPDMYVARPDQQQSDANVRVDATDETDTFTIIFPIFRQKRFLREIVHMDGGYIYPGLIALSLV